MTTPTKTLLIDNEFARVTLWRCNCTLTERKKPYAFYLSPCQSKAPICARDAEVPWPRKPADPDPRYQRHCVNCRWVGDISKTGTYFLPNTNLTDDVRPDGEDVCPWCRRTVFMGPGTVKVNVFGVPIIEPMLPMFSRRPPPDPKGNEVRYTPDGPICAATRRADLTVWICNREMGHDGYHVATDWMNQKIRGAW